MAPSGIKRRRGENDVGRPKKTLKPKVKKQKYYHSSSEDDSEDEGQFIAQDAPKKQLPVIVKASEQLGTPKSILKQKLGSQQQRHHEGEGPGEELGVSTLEFNTAMNTNPQESDGDDDDNDPSEAETGASSGSEAYEDAVEDQDVNNDDDDVVDEDDEDEDEDEDEGDGDLESETSSAAARTKKRNDPTAFATSISKILDTKLTTSKRSDPVLSRSKTAADANKSIADSRLEQEARAQMRAEKKAALEKGRVKDVLGLDAPEVDTGAILEVERRLKKTAQRGVVKLFNAVRAAQVKAEQGMREAQEQGVVGMKQREERVNEMSKQGFLDLISSGGKPSAAATVV